MGFRKYRRTQIAEMVAYDLAMDITDVSISKADRENKSPKIGDMIARNPINHDDKWLVAKDYFMANFEAIMEEKDV